MVQLSYMTAPSTNIFWLTASRVISLILLFLAYTQLFRYLGPYVSGQFQFVLSFTTIFGVVIDFGIQQYITKKISEEPEKAKKYFQNFFAVESVLIVLVYATMLAVALISNYEAIVLYGIMVAGFGIALHGLVYPFLSVMSAFYDLRKVAFINLLSSVINFFIILGTIYFEAGILMLFSQQFIYAIWALFFYYHFVQKHIGPPQILQSFKDLDYNLVKKILVAAFPFALLVGFSTIYNRIDIVLISKILGYEQTGLYTAAYKFYDLIAFFPAIVSLSLYPLFASLMAQNKIVEVREIIQKYLRFMMALALPIAVGGSIMADQIILLVAGEQFAGASTILSVLVWAPTILYVYIVVNALIISQLTKFAIVITGINVIINVIGNLILLPKYGIVAAAGMTIVAEFLQGSFYFYFVRKKITQFHFWRYLPQPILAVVAMGFLVWQIKTMSIFLVVPIAALVYGVLLLILGFIKRDDITFIKNLIMRNNASIETKI